jgi:hypothetical protein
MSPTTDGSISFDDSDATAARSPDSELTRKELFLIGTSP